MPNSEKENQLNWILDSYRKVSLTEIVGRLQEILGINIDENEWDLQSELATYLERDLTSDEVFRLRPILMDIYDNYYGEE